MEVEILGKLTRVNCPPGQEEALQAAADELNLRLTQMTERTKVHHTEQLLTIAALNACFEVQQLQKEQELSQKNQLINDETAERLVNLSKTLDNILIERSK